VSRRDDDGNSAKRCRQRYREEEKRRHGGWIGVRMYADFPSQVLEEMGAGPAGGGPTGVGFTIQENKGTPRC